MNTLHTLDLEDVPAAYAALADLPMEAEAEPESYEALAPWLQELEGEDRPADRIDEHLLYLAKVARQLEAEADFLQDRAKAIARRASARSKRAEHLKRYLKGVMEFCGIERSKDPLISVWLQRNPPSIPEDGVDLEQLPAVYKRERLVVDVLRQQILADFKTTGAVPPGVTIVTDRQSVRIR